MQQIFITIERMKKMTERMIKFVRDDIDNRVQLAAMLAKLEGYRIGEIGVSEYDQVSESLVRVSRGIEELADLYKANVEVQYEGQRKIQYFELVVPSSGEPVRIEQVDYITLSEKENNENAED